MKKWKERHELVSLVSALCELEFKMGISTQAWKNVNSKTIGFFFFLIFKYKLGIKIFFNPVLYLIKILRFAKKINLNVNSIIF